MLAVAVAEEMLLVLPVALAVGVMAVALMLELLILVVGVVGLMEPVAQAALASSSLNTTHLHNPYSHSKVLAHGSHLLAYLLLTTLWLRVALVVVVQGVLVVVLVGLEQELRLV
jgi:hypothetical protein